MEYGISWIGGGSQIMPRDRDVVKQSIERYILADSKEHNTLSPQMYDTLDTLFDDLEQEEGEDFKRVLAEIVQEIINDKEISYDFYKSDNYAWSQYLRGGGNEKAREALRVALDNYARETTLYEVYTGSNDYQRMKGYSMFKFGRDMENLPEFALERFLRENPLTVKADKPPYVLEVKIKKKDTTKKTMSFTVEYNKYAKERLKGIENSKELYGKMKKEQLLNLYNESLEGDGLMGVGQRTMTKPQLVEELSNRENSLTRNPVFSKQIGKALTLSFKLVPEDARDKPTLYYSLENNPRGILQASEDLAQAFLDAKEKQIKSRGVFSGGFLATTDLKWTEGKTVELKDFKGAVSLLAKTTSGQQKPILSFTFEDMIPEDFLSSDKEEEVYYYKVGIDEIMQSLKDEPDVIKMLQGSFELIDTVSVNKVELKLSFPSLAKLVDDDIKISRAGGDFAYKMRGLTEQLKRIKADLIPFGALKAEYDSGPYASGGQYISAEMANHIDLMKERLEDLADFGVEIKGQVDNMEED